MPPNRIATDRIALGSSEDLLIIDVRPFDKESGEPADPTAGAGIPVKVAFRQDGQEPALSEFKTAEWIPGSYVAATRTADIRYTPFAPLAENLVRGRCQIWTYVPGSTTAPKRLNHSITIY